MAKHRKQSRSALYQCRWYDGRRWHLTQVRGDRQKQRLAETLAAVPWVDKVEFVAVGVRR